MDRDNSLVQTLGQRAFRDLCSASGKSTSAERLITVALIVSAAANDDALAKHAELAARAATLSALLKGWKVVRRDVQMFDDPAAIKKIADGWRKELANVLKSLRADGRGAEPTRSPVATFLKYEMLRAEGRDEKPMSVEAAMEKLMDELGVDYEQVRALKRDGSKRWRQFKRWLAVRDYATESQSNETDNSRVAWIPAPSGLRRTRVDGSDLRAGRATTRATAPTRLSAEVSVFRLPTWLHRLLADRVERVNGPHAT